MPVFPPHLDETTSAAPGISPGPVKDEEFLLREIFNPYHVKDGKLLNTVISLQDLRYNGFSVHRMAHVTAEFVKKSIEERLSKSRRGEPWKEEGAAKLKTLNVREICLENRQALVVIDRALKDNPGHASIYAADPKKGDAHARELRSLLLPLLQERISVDKAFEEMAGTI